MQSPNYLSPGRFIDSGSPDIIRFAEAATADATVELDNVVQLYRAVRDGIVYDPYVDMSDHGPAASPGQRLDGVHVDGVDVGTFLAIDLDVDEPLVHDGGHVVILEALVGHDVAPVAGGIADGEQHRPVLGPGAAERLRSPRVPVHRVVPVLAQVGRGLIGEPVHVADATGAAPRRSR